MILECDIGNTRCKWRVLGEGAEETRGAFDCVDGFGGLPSLDGIRRQARRGSLGCDDCGL